MIAKIFKYRRLKILGLKHRRINMVGLEISSD